MERLICLAIGYVFGMFQTGYFYGKMNHIDIRNFGSGNAGTTNTLRTLGWKAGAITFVGDCLKCVLAVAIVKVLFAQNSTVDLYAMYAGLGVVLGHNYPCYLGFKGGKGIAATAGLVLATNPVMFLSIATLFILIVVITKYVSLGSLVIMILFAIEVFAYGCTGGFALAYPELIELYVITLILVGLAFWRHRANIKRLMSGTENKMKFGKQK